MVKLSNLLKNPFFIIGAIIFGVLLISPIPGDELIGLVPMFIAFLLESRRRNGGEKEDA